MRVDERPCRWARCCLPTKSLAAIRYRARTCRMTRITAGSAERAGEGAVFSKT